VIRTGLRARHGEWVFYAVEVSEPALPGTRFGIMAGRRLPGGSLAGDVVTNETSGPDRSAGFHALSGPMTVHGEDVPAFGYVVGTVARITVVAAGKPVTARHAVWSEDPSVVVFWFDPAAVPPGTRLTDLTAYDRNGRRMARSSGGFGVG
jgi:hypothetical protein